MPATKTKPPELAGSQGFLYPPLETARGRQSLNYRPKNRVKVDGKMSTNGADSAGNKLANAALLAAFLFGSAAVITAVGFLFK